jgi:dienelactone hydrolase
MKSETGVLFRSITHRGTERKYAVYVPRNYEQGKNWPLVVFLNGRGECGTDGQKQLAVGLIPAAMLEPARWPVLILAIQKPDADKQWIEYDDYVMSAIAETRQQFAVDPARIYLTGLSQGGAGTWAIGAAHPDFFAALAPVCGYGDPTPALGEALKGMPIWAFHGGKDDVVLPQKTEALVNAVNAAGGSPKLTIFPDANHNSWDAAYRGQDLGPWLLAQTRK